MTKQRKTSTEMMITDTKIMDKIYIIRNQKVMLDRDLAELYGVETVSYTHLTLPTNREV